jgi:hypothetical protein
MGRHSLAGGVAALAATAALIAGQIGVSASTYAGGSVGYDISYPQCGTSYPSGAFGVVGVNQGYPFTYYNSCFSSEWAHAATTASPSLYVNTGYDPSYTNSTDGRHTTQDCLTRSSSIIGTSSQKGAWAVGCSEAERSVAYASCGNNTIPTTCSSLVKPAVWWLDIETGNSWCGQSGTACTDLTLNQYTVQGILDTLHTQAENPGGSPVGIYSTSSQWSAITGGNLVSGINADWVATGVRSAKRARPYCTSNGFAGSAPVWLVQYLPGSYDADYAC